MAASNPEEDPTGTHGNHSQVGQRHRDASPCTHGLLRRTGCDDATVDGRLKRPLSGSLQGTVGCSVLCPVGGSFYCPVNGAYDDGHRRTQRTGRDAGCYPQPDAATGGRRGHAYVVGR